MTDQRWDTPSSAPHPAPSGPAHPRPARKPRWGRRALVAGGLVAAVAVSAFGYRAVTTAPQGTPQAVELADATLSDGLTSATVLAVGEATHGTAEFRTIWQQIAAKVVDRGFTTIVIEENAGAVSQVNAFVQGGPGTAEDAAKRFGFRLSRTREMAAFLTWARDYNAGKPAGQRVQFYGLDMQRPSADRDVALAWLTTVDAPAATSFADQLAPITDDTAYDKAQAATMQPVAEEFAAKVEAVAAGRNDDATLRARLSARTLVQSMKRGQNVATYDRDADLAATMAWLVERRSAVGSKHALWLAHNGHVGHGGLGTMAAGSRFGKLADERWGEGYKVIASDAHRVGLREQGDAFSFTVDSPVRGLFAGTKIGFLEFAQAKPENRAVLEAAQPMLSAGAGFAAWHAWLPPFHSMPITHAKAWDALVYVDESQPTTPLP